MTYIGKVAKNSHKKIGCCWFFESPMRLLGIALWMHWVKAIWVNPVTQYQGLAGQGLAGDCFCDGLPEQGGVVLNGWVLVPDPVLV